jgi:hypothetical protein
MERIRTSRAARWALVGAIGLVAAFLLSFIFAGFRNVVALLVSPVAAIGIYEGVQMPWSARELALLGAVLIAAVLLFVASPSYIGRLGR